MKMNTGRSIHTIILIVGILLCTDSLILAQQGIDEVRALEPGKPIERELAPKAVHVYRIKLTSGQVLRAAVDRRGIPMWVYGFTPDGRSLGSFTTSGWHEYEISGEVAADALMIDYGLALVGEGRAWLDDVTIEFN